jgi:hypothetical protein
LEDPDVQNGELTVDSSVDYDKGAAAGVVPSVVVALASIMALFW